MVNAQEWLDNEYPDRRNEITELDISKGKVKRWPNHERTLKGDLKLEGFTNLRILKCSGQELTDLDLGECQFLTELDCHDNQLNNLNVSGCRYLGKINCSDNHLRDLDLSSCTKIKEINCSFNNYLEEIDISKCPELTKIGFEFTRDVEKGKLVKVSQITLAGDNVRNILIVGITGNGKSTLANVLTETEEFRSEGLSTSVTENFKKSDVFEWEGKKYCIIDNIGFSDTSNLSKKDLLFKVGEGVYSAKEGINQVLFVFKGKFTPVQIEAFDVFKKLISETGITRFTTLVRTNFKSFKEPQRCAEDKQDLLTQNKELSEIINSCNPHNNVIHVNNPFVSISAADDEDDEEKEEREKMIGSNKKDREESKRIVLNHLVNNCQEIYKLKEWDSIHDQVAECMKQIEEKKKELAKTNNPSEKTRLQSEIKEKEGKIAEKIDAEFTAEVSLNPKLIAKVMFNDVNLRKLWSKQSS